MWKKWTVHSSKEKKKEKTFWFFNWEEKRKPCRFSLTLGWCQNVHFWLKYFFNAFMKSDLHGPRVFFMFLLFSPLMFLAPYVVILQLWKGNVQHQKGLTLDRSPHFILQWACVISPCWGTSDRQTVSWHQTHSTNISASSREDSSHKGALLITKRLWLIHTK